MHCSTAGWICILLSAQDWCPSTIELLKEFGMPTEATVSNIPRKLNRIGIPANSHPPPTCSHTSNSQLQKALASAAPREKPNTDKLMSSMRGFFPLRLDARASCQCRNPLRRIEARFVIDAMLLDIRAESSSSNRTLLSTYRCGELSRRVNAHMMRFSPFQPNAPPAAGPESPISGNGVPTPGI